MTRIAVDTEGGDTTFVTALQRARAEFTEMPGMRLTVDQAARLWAFDRALCDAVLRTLVDMRFLVQTRHWFVRAERA
jgi:hypothetical protein